MHAYTQGKRRSMPPMLQAYPEGGSKRDLMHLPCVLDAMFLDAATGMYVCVILMHVYACVFIFMDTCVCMGKNPVC
jgi:hypothetical protein